MAADKGESRTELACLPSRHAAAHPEGLGFVRGGKYDPATDGDTSHHLRARGGNPKPHPIYSMTPGAQRRADLLFQQQL
jgi:hypothetical protein